MNKFPFVRLRIFNELLGLQLFITLIPVVFHTTSFKGTIYLMSNPDKEKHKEKQGVSVVEMYGHKFEQYMTGGMDSIVALDGYIFFGI